MQVQEFNQLSPQAAADIVRPCADVDSWVEALVTGRPWDDVESLLAEAVHRAATWSDAEVDHALAGHPRIGERGDAASVREQSGVGEGLADRLADANHRYEERFGRIYLVRAAGRSGEELLDLLEQRLANDPETERAVVHGQLAEIAVLRLQGVFA